MLVLVVLVLAVVVVVLVVVLVVVVLVPACWFGCRGDAWLRVCGDGVQEEGWAARRERLQTTETAALLHSPPPDCALSLSLSLSPSPSPSLPSLSLSLSLSHTHTALPAYQ